jgi:hypothetical protein
MSRMIKILMMVLVSVALSLGGAAMLCAKDLPAADGKAVWTYITKTNPYQKWAMWPGTDALYKGRHPHGALLTTYVSKGALKAIDNKAGMLPNGAFVIKENYSPEKKLGAVTVMYRVNGYDADAGDWFWAKYKPSGEIAKAGKVAGCIGCHAAKIGNDWIFTGEVQ